MKKVLFATTALVASAGVAAAQGVALSGSAEMGIVGGDRTLDGTATDVVQFWNDVDIAFTLSGESDNGLTFGANVDLDEAANLGGEADNQGTSVFISGDWGTLTLGDTDGALDRVMQEANTAGDPGSIADDETTHAGYLGSFGDGGGGDNQVLRYEYSFGDFLFAISHEQGAQLASGVVVTGDPDGSSAIGIRYSTMVSNVDLTVGLGYQMTDFNGVGLGTTDQTIVGVSVLAEFAAGFSAVVGYSDWSDVAGVAGVDDSHAYIGLGYATGPFSIHANYGEFDSGNSGYGLAAAYDLGGGASLNLGYGHSDGAGINPVDLSDSASFWSFGVAMSF
ncbi:porin [Rhodobacterales bacterium HKCCE3408]|nr:porin [Rhodobacterales bacterium HKCCE3408]